MDTPITTENELPADARANWLRAVSAIELRNYGYAITLIQMVLKTSPYFLDGRKRLRQAEIAHTKGKKSVLSGLTGGAGLKGAGLVKKDPLAALEAAEKALESDPFNTSANNLLKDAGKALQHNEIAAFALETLIKGNPEDTKLMHELGELYTLMQENEKAVNLYTKIAELDPADLVAVKRAKDSAASQTINSGGWGEAKTYRDLMKNKDQAVQLEVQNRVFKDTNMIDSQIQELGEQYNENPQNVDVSRRIAALYDQRQQLTSSSEDLANAVQWYGYTNELAKGSDPSVARKLSDLQMKQVEMRIKELQEWLTQYGEENEHAPGVRDELEGLHRQKAETLISEAKRRVERNPTDLQLRYELGERLVDAGQYTEAIPELQQAKRNPNARLKAMNLLGKCFSEKGMLDMAISQYKSAASEMTAMDVVKKDVLYKLGLVLEKTGNASEYLDCMKQIYEADYGYRDVAQRVENSYTAA